MTEVLKWKNLIGFPFLIILAVFEHTMKSDDLS